MLLCQSDPKNSGLLSPQREPLLLLQRAPLIVPKAPMFLNFLPLPEKKNVSCYLNPFFIYGALQTPLIFFSPDDVILSRIATLFKPYFHITCFTPRICSPMWRNKGRSKKFEYWLQIHRTLISIHHLTIFLSINLQHKAPSL